MVDPFEPDPVVRVYEPVPAEELHQLVPLRRPPYCNCPRAVRPDGSIIVWHQPECDGLREEGGLAAIL